MINPHNNGTWVGGIASDPELVADGKVMNFRLAVNYSGRDQANPDNKAGYFDVVAFQNDKNVEFLFRQVSEGKMGKGSQIVVTGSLNHERFAVDGNNRSRVVIIANGVTYVPGMKRDETASTDSTEETHAPKTASPVVPDDF